MASERIDYNKGTKNSPSKYEKYLYCNVALIMSDGGIFDGIIESIEENHIIMLVGEDVIELDDNDDDYESHDEKRQYGNMGHNRRPRRRSRRFRRRPFPFPNVVAVELLPYIPPYPYPYPYPYY